MLKPKLQPYLKKIEPLAAAYPFHPTTITVAGFGFGVLGFSSMLLGYPYVSLILFLFAFGTDALDGAVARAKNLVSPKGAFLDGILDRAVEFLLILTLWVGFAWTLPEQLALIAVLFFGTCMTSFAKAYAEHSGMLRHETAISLPGVLERTERSVILLAIFILSVVGSSWISGLLYLCAGLSGLTLTQRVLVVINKK